MEHNPFAAPSIESMEVEPSENVVGLGLPLTPGVPFVAVCVVLGILSKIVVFYGIAFLMEAQWIEMWSWVLEEVVWGAIAGLGAAVFFHAVRRGQLTQLMPGHWRLVAISGVIVGDLLYTFAILTHLVNEDNNFMGVQIIFQQGIRELLAAALYLMVIRTTGETYPWRVYAWMSLVCYVVMLLASLASPFWFDGFAGAGFGSVYIVLTGISNLIAAVILVLLLMAIVIDFRRKIPRDAYHYLGLALPIAALLFQVGLNSILFGF